MNNKVSFSPIGYKYLAGMLENCDYKYLPSDTSLYISATKPYKIKLRDGNKDEIRTYNGKLPSNIFEHLEITLKYEDINLSLLNVLFSHISENEELLTDFEAQIKSKSTGKIERQIWFLYEFLTNGKLNISNLGKRNYIDLLDDEKYFTSSNPVKSQRHAINNNFLSPNPKLCPIVRKTQKLQNFVQRNFGKEISETILSYQDKLHLVYKAINYLYVSETRGTFGIERLTPPQSRQAVFIKILEEQSKTPIVVTKNSLIKLQNKFVEPRYKDDDYRKSQIFVGNSKLSSSQEYMEVDFIGAKTNDVEDLMSEFFTCYGNLLYSDINAVIAATILSFAFVYIHPFSDGNGRITRYLIHNVLSLKHIMPEGLIFPVSAYMLKNISSYYDILNTFSKKFMSLVDYEMQDLEINVLTETKELYSFIDFTKHAEYLFDCIDNTLREDFTKELEYLGNYETTRILVKEVVDLPDVKLNNLIKFIKQNGNKLPNRRRSKDFAELTDKEISKLEQIINEKLLYPSFDNQKEPLILDSMKTLEILNELKLEKASDFEEKDEFIIETIKKFYPQYKNADNLINLIKVALKFWSRC